MSGQIQKPTVALIGYGFVGRAYHRMFPEAIIYDPFSQEPCVVRGLDGQPQRTTISAQSSKDKVNQCEIAIIAVPTDLKDGKLDTSIVEEIIGWLKTPLILIKSALQPGTTDRLVKETKKNIAVSLEMVGEGKYAIPFWKYPHPEDPRYHQFLIVGGEETTATKCANFLWQKMSPSVDVHILSAVEVEIAKMMENTWGAMKVTFANTIYDICEDLGANYTKVLQAWGADGRVEKMHMRVVPGKRGWKSKCYDKDVPAFAKLDKSGFLEKLVKVNQGHLDA